jgi:glucose/arabinose dehydrogenase
LVLPAVLLTLLAACGGGGESTNSDTAAAADSSTAPADATTIGTKVLVVGTADGLAAAQMATALPQGTANDFEILVVGRDKGHEAEVQTSVQKALGEGKTVVLDGNAEGGVSQEAQQALKAITGASFEAEAYMIQSAPGSNGYLVTPIDSPQTAATQRARAGLSLASAPAIDNSVANVFGLNGGNQ